MSPTATQAASAIFAAADAANAPCIALAEVPGGAAAYDRLCRAAEAWQRELRMAGAAVAKL